MRRKHLLLYALLSTLALAGVGGCRKNVDEFRPYPVTLEDIELLFQQVPDPATQTVFTMNGAVPDTTLHTPGGVQVTLTDTEQLFMDADGKLVPCSTCKDLQIEITEAFRKGDMLAQNIATADSDGNLFESSGAVRLVVKCDGKPLQLLANRNIKIQIPATDPKLNWNLFTFGTKDSTMWENTQEQAYAADWPGPNNEIVKGYELIAKTLGWVSAGNVPQAGGVSFCLDLPPNLNPQNTVAFLVFKNTKILVPLEVPDNIDNFCFSNVLSGYPVRIVTVSKFDGQYWVGQKEDETGLNATTKSVEPKLMTEQQVLDFLRGL